MKKTPRIRKEHWWNGIWSRINFWSLLSAFVALLLFFIFWHVLGRADLLGSEEFRGERATTTVAMVAGVGGAAYWTIRIRAQRLAEKQDQDSVRTRRDEEFQAAISDLTKPEPLVRLSAVRRIVRHAETEPERFITRAVQVFCQYLRLPAPNQDQLVRESILDAIRRHLDESAPCHWGSEPFDLRGAKFTFPVNLDGSVFGGAVDLSDATFVRGISFRNARVSGVFRIMSARIDGAADFDGTTFGDLADFWKTSFRQEVSFRKCSFAHAVVFGQDLRWFSQNASDSFSKVPFTFFGPATFDQSIFAGEALFGSASRGEGNQLRQRRIGVRFGDRVSFCGARFKAEVSFQGAEFAQSSVESDSPLVDFRAFRAYRESLQPTVFEGPAIFERCKGLAFSKNFFGSGPGAAQFHSDKNFDGAKLWEELLSDEEIDSAPVESEPQRQVEGECQQSEKIKDSAPPPQGKDVPPPPMTEVDDQFDQEFGPYD